MITITMEQLIDFRNGGDFLSTLNLPLKAAYKINKIKQGVEKEADFYATKFQEIIDTYAKKDDDGNIIFSDDGSQILIQDDKINECNEALEDLQKLEIEIDNYNLSIDDLGDVECTPEQLEAIMPFID